MWWMLFHFSWEVVLLFSCPFSPSLFYGRVLPLSQFLLPPISRVNWPHPTSAGVDIQFTFIEPAGARQTKIVMLRESSFPNDKLIYIYNIIKVENLTFWWTQLERERSLRFSVIKTHELCYLEPFSNCKLGRAVIFIQKLFLGIYGEEKGVQLCENTIHLECILTRLVSSSNSSDGGGGSPLLSVDLSGKVISHVEVEPSPNKFFSSCDLFRRPAVSLLRTVPQILCFFPPQPNCIYFWHIIHIPSRSIQIVFIIHTIVKQG